jgi:hypothetical protein
MGAPNPTNAARGSKFTQGKRGARCQAAAKSSEATPRMLSGRHADRPESPAGSQAAAYIVRRRRDIIQMTTARTITTRMIHQ